jgi:HK97 family phage portal protein
MAVIQSVGALADVSTGWWPSVGTGSIQLYDLFNYDYATLYRTQPNVRTCVDFLARNIAQLGLHVFRRVSDTDRVRLTDHPLAQLINKPLPAEFKVTRYRLIETLMGDLGVYFNAYWLKVRSKEMGLLRIPPAFVTVYGGLTPTKYEMTLGGKPYTFGPNEIVHFRGYNPSDPVNGLSPLETLRRVLAEEHSAGDYREHFWQNAARQAGVIERPKDAPDWSETARGRFKAEFEALYSGGDNSGRTAILEEGMTWKPGTFNAQESEYLAGRKLTREECARAYHIPLPMVGILDNATFSNIQEQHRNLYQDSLGPWLAMLEQDIELQLLPDFEDIDGVYIEFNIAEKLQGDFGEQTKSMQAAVGRPWMTADEARARMNLPSLGGDAEQLVTPLNVLVGGQASPQDSAPPPKGEERGEKGEERGARSDGRRAAGEVDPTQPELREAWRKKWARQMAKFFERQRDVVVKKANPKGRQGDGETGRQGDKGKKELPDLAVLWDASRWDAELTADFHKLSAATTLEFAQYVSDQLGEDLDASEMEAWIAENSRIAAENVNGVTRAQVEEALKAEDPLDALRGVFELALSVRAAEIALSRTTSLANFGTMNAARQGGLKTKTWHVNSSNPRPSHAALSGSTVGIKDLFSNGLMWPGDPKGSAAENANCSCSVTFGRGE